MSIHKIKTICIITILILFLITMTLQAQWQIDLENGIRWSGYNDIRIPGNTGTFFSFSEELKSEPSYFIRLQTGYTFKKRHTLFLLYSPLKITAVGKLDRDIIFTDKIFPAGTDLLATFKFNSYRLTYRYTFVNNENIKFGMGLTSKIRDAFIKVEGGGREGILTDLGYVPIINFQFIWKIRDNFEFHIDGDAAAAPQGRAEDILSAFIIPLNDNIQIKAGYRILEGGADNDKVYTFTLFHYAVAGISLII